MNKKHTRYTHPLTRWMWRIWFHAESDAVVRLPFWRNPNTDFDRGWYEDKTRTLEPKKGYTI